MNIFFRYFSCRCAAALTLLFIVFLLPLLSHGSGGQRHRVGYVAAKGVVLSKDGNPYWVVYNSKGDIEEIIGEITGEFDGSWLMPAAEYRFHYAGFLSVQNQYSGRSRILLREEYESHNLSDGAGNPIIDKPALLPSTRSVVVKNADITFSAKDILLYQSPINLEQAKPISSDASSLLLNEDGVVIHEAEGNIGKRVAFYTPQDFDPSSEVFEDMLDDGNRSLWNFKPNDDKLWGPMEGVLVESSLSRRGSGTSADGRYSLSYFIPPCPGFYWSYDSMIMATLKYSQFNPNGKKLHTYFATAKDYDFCSGIGDFPPGYSLGGLMAQMSAMSIDMSTESQVLMRRVNMAIDMAMLSGEAELRNSLTDPVLPQADETVYTYNEVEFQPIIPVLDLDGDNRVDVVEYNREKNQLSIWYGLADPENDPPNIVRQADYSSDFTHQGLVKQLSKGDLRNTDTFLYRVSNGQLFSARNGLLGGETEQVAVGDVSGIAEAKIHYSQIIRGPVRTNLNQEPLELWQSKTGVNKELRGWRRDHIRTGEQLKVMMINRATGYMGSTIATYGENTQKGGIISFSPQKLAMLPPNLKIKVERRRLTDVGLNKGDENIFTIGFEGSGLTSDEVIAITTEWYDHDGSPLPEDLPGFTGRLAKVVGVSTLGQASDQISNFPIKPGRNLVVVKLPQAQLDTAHYYLHVNGEAMEGRPDFSTTADFATTGAGDEALQFRPKHYVPVRVPLYDKELTEEAKKVRQQAIEEAIAKGEEPDIPEVTPIYQWVYRPEMQFSLFDLKKVEHINPENPEENENLLISGVDVFDIFNSFTFLYEILESTFDPLTHFGPNRELVFSLGNKEILVKYGPDGITLDFSDIDFSTLDPSEILALRLYQKGDDANMLWEYNIPMGDLDIDSDNDDGLNLPKRDNNEDKLEYSKHAKPGSLESLGKIIGIHKGNADGDNLPDFIDFEYNPVDVQNEGDLIGFVPIIFEIPPSIKPEEAKLRFIYSASDPNPSKTDIVPGPTIYETTYSLAPGHLRIWTRDNSKETDKQRIVSDVNNGGHFVNSTTNDNNSEYSLLDLKDEKTQQINEHTLTLFVEAVRPAVSIDSKRISIQIDSGSGFITADTVTISAIEMEIAVGLNDSQFVEFEEDYSHRRTIINPFRFWLNNDFDVVSSMGKIDINSTRCPEQNDRHKATCEQWDEEPVWAENLPHPHQYCSNGNSENCITISNYSMRSNIYPGIYGDGIHSNIGIIESERDLEDFAPMAMKLIGLKTDSTGGIELPSGWKLKIRSKDVGINLYRGAWTRGSEYLFDEKIASEQVRKDRGLYLFSLVEDKEQEISLKSDVSGKNIFDQNGISRFIFEGLQESKSVYNPNSEVEEERIPKETFVEVYMEGKGHKIILGKTYISIKDLKAYYDHYTSGTGYYAEQIPENPVILQKGTSIHNHIDAENYILLVHGWRMQNWERVSFAETSFKRLFWSGYKGGFGVFSWPTGWFPKPAHIYNEKLLAWEYLRGYEQNYGHSEIVARLSSKALSKTLDSINQNKDLNTHVIAHSMGNIVTSEALKLNTEGNQSSVASYAALMSASAAGAYSNDAEDNLEHHIKAYPDLTPSCSGVKNSEDAWRCYNSDSMPDRDYDMPPDKYKYNVPDPHRGYHYYDRYFTDEVPSEEELKKPYYFRNNDWSKNINIINFHSELDIALQGWEFNQLTKPDAGYDFYSGSRPGEEVYNYRYQWQIVSGCDRDCDENGDPDDLAVVKDFYSFKHQTDNSDSYSNLIWQEPENGTPPTVHTAIILSHILPARTIAMGRGPIDRNLNFDLPIDMTKNYNLTNSNQDHSAVFHSTFYLRAAFWRELLREFKILLVQ